MNLPALAGVVFGTGITYATTESKTLTLLSASAGLITTGILSSDQNDYSGPGDFCKTACASMSPILFYEKEQEEIPLFPEDEDDYDILDMPLWFD